MKKELEIILESIEGFSKPMINLEQYTTPPVLAAEVVVNANLIGDLKPDSTLVIDLGCGTGILSIAASLLGVKTIGLDVDINALNIAKKNVKKVGTEKYTEFVACRIENIPLKLGTKKVKKPESKIVLNDNSKIDNEGDTNYSRKNIVVIMNPPFGIQKKHADRPFIEVAMRISEVIYSIHSAGSEKYIEKVCRASNFKITHLWRYKIPLKRSYKFHEKDFKYIAVEIFRIVKDNV